MRIAYVMIVVLMFAAPVQASAQETGSDLFEQGYLESLSKLIDWIQRLDKKVGSWVKTEQTAQLGRRTERLAAQLYELCSSKQALVIAVNARQSTAGQLRERADKVSQDIQNAFDALVRFGADLVKAGEEGPEQAITSGLGGKAIMMEQIADGLTTGQIDRKKIAAEVQNSYDLCRAAQAQAAKIAVKLAGS